MKVTPIIMILTALVVLVTFCCSSAYPMNNETIGSVSNEVTDVPKYHMRIHIKEYVICFGALVNIRYIAALKSECLDNVQIFNVAMEDISIYGGRKDVSDTNKPVIPIVVNISREYNIGVIEVNAFAYAEVINLRVFNHLLQPNKNVQIYGFNNMFKHEGNAKTIMNMDNMVTIERNKLKSCLHVSDFITTISTINKAITSVDTSSPIVYTNEKGELRLIGFAHYHYDDCQNINEQVIFTGCEVSHYEIANQLEELSNRAIRFRYRNGQRNE